MAEDPKDKAPTPEVLQPQVDESAETASAPAAQTAAATPPKITIPRRGAYRPSHKATFFGLTAVGIILAINAVAIAFVLRGQTPSKDTNTQAEVTLDPESLNKLGVSRTAIGSSGIELIVNPQSRFNNKVTVGGDLNVAGQFKLNSKLVATDANLSKLEAGDSSLNSANINGDASASNLALRKDLTVAGSTRVQGPMTLSQLLTVNNSVNIAGNLVVGGTLSIRDLHVSNFSTDAVLTVGGHVITRGAAPGVSAGSVGSNGTVSISGNDAAGTVAVNVGAGGASGILANVTFRTGYSATPHVVITQVGAGGSGVYVTRSSSGFGIGVNGSLGPGGYAFDYVVVQ
jgi:hypothetical protein